MSEESPITNHESPVTGSDTPVTSHQSPVTDQEDEISLLDLLIVLAKHKKLILGLPLAAAILAAMYSLSLPNIYTATTKILPPQQSQSTASAMLAQLGGLAGLAGGVAGIKNPNDLYVSMLKSRTVADNLIQRFDLNNLFQQKLQSGTRAVLAGMTNIKSEKDGMITIEVDDKDPKRAAELANAYADELYKLTNVLAVTEASQRRLFFERQLVQAKDNLAKTEAVAKQALQKGGLVQVEGQGRAMIEAAARLRGQITVKEVQIGAMRTFATERNPDILAAQQELRVMKQELAKMEGAGGTKIRENSPADNSQGIDNLSLLRDVKYYETIYELLAKQYELAKLDEAKDSAIIQVLDKAIEPDVKSKPKRRQFVLIWTFVAIIVVILLAFVSEALETAKNDPQKSKRLARLKSYLWLRRGSTAR
jgi:tyrosine-protein kinase Etk/Wzc